MSYPKIIGMEEVEKLLRLRGDLTCEISRDVTGLPYFKYTFVEFEHEHKFVKEGLYDFIVLYELFQTIKKSHLWNECVDILDTPAGCYPYYKASGSGFESAE